MSTGEEGWVSSGYITLNPNSALEPGNTSELVKLLLAWKLPIFLVLLAGAVVLLAFLMGKLSPEEFQGPPLLVILVSLALGFTFLLNQFGLLFVKLTAPYFDITALTPLWGVNSVCAQVGYPTVLVILFLLTLAIGVTAPAEHHCRASFFQGASAGFLILPVACLAGAIAAAVIWLISKIFLLVGYILGIILIPVAWLFTHAILPVLRFLAIPLVWIWESFLRDFLLLIAIPFIWIKNVILAPLFYFLAKYVVKPIFFLFVGVVGIMMFLFPFAAIGLAILDSARSSVKASLDSKGLFSQGMAMGFCLWDASLLISLNHFGILHSTPPLSLLVLLALPVIVLLRLLVSREAALDPALEPTFTGKFSHYCKSSKIGLLSSCVFLPLCLAILIYQTDDSGGG